MDAVEPPPPSPMCVCLSGRPAGTRDACSRSPCAPPCPAAPHGGSGEGRKGCLSPPRSFNILEPPPPGDTRGGAAGWFGRHAHSYFAGRACRVTRAGEGDREQGRLRALGEPRTAWDAATEPAPAGGLCRPFVMSRGPNMQVMQGAQGGAALL